MHIVRHLFWILLVLSMQARTAEHQDSAPALVNNIEQIPSRLTNRQINLEDRYTKLEQRYDAVDALLNRMILLLESIKLSNAPRNQAFAFPPNTSMIITK